MDNRLVIVLLFVTLSWITNTTSATGTTMEPATGTTVAPAAGNTATTAAPAAGNTATTVAPAAGNTATTAAPATGNATTVAPPATAAPPLTPNTTVETLTVPVSNQGCGSQQLCAAQPSSCNPSSGSCFFLAAKQQSGRNFEFALSGDSDGYIAASLSRDSELGGDDPTYVCANNNGAVKFFSTVLNNGQLTVQELNVNSVKGRINGRNIQCTFAATVPNPVTRAENLAVAISTGPFNSTTNSLGAPRTILQSPVVNLADPNTTITNQVPQTTAPSQTTSHAITLQQSLMQALLITVGVLGMTML